MGELGPSPLVDLNSLEARRVGGEPIDEAEYFYACETCGEAVDIRRPGDVLHHEQSEHEPLRNPS